MEKHAKPIVFFGFINIFYGKAFKTSGFLVFLVFLMISEFPKPEFSESWSPPSPTPG